MRALTGRVAVAALAAWSASLVASAALGSLDGAGLFALPAERVPAAGRIDPPYEVRLPRRLTGQIRALLPAIERLRGFAVTPTVLGRGGIGVRISGKL